MWILIKAKTVIIGVSGYAVIFTITDGTSPVEGAELSLTGYGSAITDAVGQATFSDVLPEENIPYSVAASGFNTASGTLTVVDSDISQTVILDLTTYSVIFTITDGTNPVEGAEVSLTGYGSDITDAEGQVAFENIMPEEDILFSVVVEGYIDVESTISIEDENLYENISLVATDIRNMSLDQFLIYPNPVNGFVHLHIVKDAAISIISSSGEIIYIQKHYTGYSTINTANFGSGIYYFKIISKNEVLIKKIIVK